VPAEAFAAIEGQDEAVSLLRRALQAGRVAHAYAFVGPAGAGRKPTALAFAKALVAPGGGAAAARVDRGAHPDVLVFRPTPPEKNPKGPLALRIETIRELERLASLRPAEAPWKVFVVEDADLMTVATPQAFLKTLEEPPARTVIILILSQLRLLPATLLSRCQIVRFRPRLSDRGRALLPDGQAPGREQALSSLAAAQTDGADAVLRIGEDVGRNREAAATLIETCWMWYRDQLCLEAAPGARLAALPSTTASAGVRPRRPGSLDALLRGLAACRDAWYALQGNVSPRLTVETLLSRLAREAA